MDTKKHEQRLSNQQASSNDSRKGPLAPDQLDLNGALNPNRTSSFDQFDFDDDEWDNDRNPLGHPWSLISW